MLDQFKQRLRVGRECGGLCVAVPLGTVRVRALRAGLPTPFKIKLEAGLAKGQLDWQCRWARRGPPLRSH